MDEKVGRDAGRHNSERTTDDCSGPAEHIRGGCYGRCADLAEPVVADSITLDATNSTR